MHMYDGECECTSCARFAEAAALAASAELARLRGGAELLLSEAASLGISVSSEARAYLLREVLLTSTIPSRSEFLAWLRAK